MFLNLKNKSVFFLWLDHYLNTNLPVTVEKNERKLLHDPAFILNRTCLYMDEYSLQMGISLFLFLRKIVSTKTLLF